MLVSRLTVGSIRLRGERKPTEKNQGPRKRLSFRRDQSVSLHREAAQIPPCCRGRRVEQVERCLLLSENTIRSRKERKRLVTRVASAKRLKSVRVSSSTTSGIILDGYYCQDDNTQATAQILTSDFPDQYTSRYLVLHFVTTARDVSPA